MSTTSIRKSDALHSAMIESLEMRQLLSGYVLDTSFGNGGALMNVQATSVRADGSIIVDDGKGLLNSDGSRGVLTTPLAPPAVLTPAQPTNVQADGKYLVITSFSRPIGIQGGSLTRYNKNGTIDKTFGTKGSISDFTALTGNSTFCPFQVFAVGSRIYLIGSTYHDRFPEDPGYVLKPSLGVLALKLDGTRDPAFGFFSNFDQPDTLSTGKFAGLGADGTLYITQDGFDASSEDEWNGYLAFSPSGKLLAEQNVTDLGDQCFVNGPNYSSKGLAAFLLGATTGHSALLSGPYGSIDVVPPSGNTEIYGGDALTGADGRIFVNYGGNATNILLCYRPAVDNTGSVSGHFFNDFNNNHKLDKNEIGQIDWQAYADINNNGVFDLAEPTGYTDFHGNYTIYNLAPGSYRIREVRQNNWNRTTPTGDWPVGGVYTVTVAANKTITGLNFSNFDTQHRVGSISGTIFNDVNGNETQDAGEPGLAGWQVYADFNNNGVYDAGEIVVATTDKTGHYKMANLVPGGYRLREVRQSGWVRTSPRGDWPLGYIDVAVAANQNVTGKSFGNAQGNSIFASISGKVFNDVNGNGKLDAGEKPAGGVVVILYNSNGQDTTTTAADGSYLFSNVDPADAHGITVYTGGTIPRRITSSPDVVDPLLRPSSTTQVGFLVQSLARFGVAAYKDVNGNAHIDPGDGPGFYGQVYIDLNNNGQLDSGEPTISAEFDEHISNWMAPGTNYVRLVPYRGSVQTYPSNNSPMVITLVAGQTLHGLIFTVTAMA